MNDYWQPIREFGISTVALVVVWLSYSGVTKAYSLSMNRIIERASKQLDQQHEEHRTDRKEDTEKIAIRFDTLITKLDLDGTDRQRTLNDVEKNCMRIKESLGNISSNVQENQDFIIKTYDNTVIVKNELCNIK